MTCPHCGKPIDAHLIAQELGRAGGSKSRRVLSSKDALAMREARTKKIREAKKTS